MWRILGFLFLGVLCFSAPSRAQEVRWNFWPFFFYSAQEGERRLEILGPLIAREVSPQEKSFSFRPFYTRVERVEEEDIYFLSPLGHYHREAAYRRLRLVPLFTYDWMAGEKEPGRHHTVFPFFWGETEDGRKYWGIFPLYGLLRERFGADEIRFFLWPLYASSRRGANRSTHILWPIFNYRRGPDIAGFKVWPIMGFRERPGKFRRAFFLWPFLIWEDRYSEDGPPETKRIFFPFWIKEEARDYRKRIYLWPFFQHLETRDGRFYQWDAPWPFVQIQQGEDRQGFRLWPLYGYRRSPDQESRFLLWPLFQHWHFQRHAEEQYEARIFLLWRFREVHREGRVVEKMVRIWPVLFRYERADGLTVFYFPALFPFYDEGMERNYGPLLRLLEYYRWPDGRCRLRLLWGLFRQECSPKKTLQEWAFILRWEKDPQGFEVSFFHGFLAFGKKEGRIRLKILWLPLLR